MLYARLAQGAAALAALAAVLTFAPSAKADLGHRFVGTIHGGAATEAGGGATLELRLLDDIAIAGSYDAGVNLKGTHGSYRWYGPAIQGSYRFKLSDDLELRPILGARFPYDLSALDATQYVVKVSTPVAFTATVRLAVIFDWFVLGVEAEVTPHGAVWTQVSTGKDETTEETLFRAALVLGVAIGKEEPKY